MYVSTQFRRLARKSRHAVVLGALALQGAFAFPALAQTSVSNTASVTLPSGVVDTDTTNNSSTATVSVIAPRLQLSKTASATSFTVGVPASYTLQVTNTGTSATPAAATITDTIPTGLTIGTLPSGCTAAGQTVTCNVAAGLAATASTSFVIPVTPQASLTGSTLTNTASVSGGGDSTCPAASRCTATVGPTPVVAPQLTLTKTASTASFTVGTAASYTLSVQNTGTTATTAAATITDTIPTGLTIGALPSGCTAAGQTVTCTVASGLAVNATTSFVIPVTPTTAAAASVTNTATVSGGGDSTCPANARCTSTVTHAVNRPQLTLAKTASAASFTVGVPASYTLQVTNTGTSATPAAATITDTIPTGLTIGTLPSGCTAAGQTVTCNVAAGLAATASTSFVIPVTPQASLTGSTLTNTASVSGGGDSTCPAASRCTATVGPTPVVAPQLTLTKTASTASFTVGTAASYTLSVQNTGTTATTAAATITDTIPTGLTIGALPSGCTAAGQTVTCTVASGLAVNATTSFVIPVTPTTAAAASVNNTATVSGGGDSTCPANARCTSTVTTAVNRPQLTLAKTASAASFTVGVPASYTLQVTNTGTSATTAVATITDTIPTGLTIGTLPSGCTAAGQTVTCNVAAGLAASASTSFVIPVTPQASLTGSTLTNTASVSGGGDSTCPAASRCTATVGPTPVVAPQLTLTKTASTASFTVGTAASYTLSVQNTGTTATTAAATITDTIPTGLTIGTLPSGCTAAGQTVTCTVASGLAVNATTSFVIPVTPTTAAAASVTNTATVSGGGDSTCPANARCTSTVTTSVNRPVINLAKAAGNVSGPDGAGNYTVTYTVTATNSGAAPGVYGVLTDRPIFSSNLVIVGASWTTSGAGVPAGGSEAGDGPYVLAPSNTALGAGVTHTYNVSITFDFATNSIATACIGNPGGGLYNAVDWAGGNETNTGDNAACVSAPLPPPQLVLTKTASAANFTTGVAASYTLQVQNTGRTATTAAATITDTIPTGLTIGTLPSGCTAAGQTVTCTVASGLAADAAASFVIPVTPTAAAAASVTNTATVDGGGDNTCPANARCSSSVTTPVTSSADVSIVKSTSTPNAAVPGQTVTWTVTVNNAGPSDAAAVTTADTVPAAVTGLTVGGANAASCTVAGQNVSCNFGTLANGATRTYTISGTLASNFTGNLVNTATVSSTTPDPTPGNNSSTSTTPSAASADAAIVKTLLTASPVQAGGTVSYQLVVSNNGPSALVAASVTDTVPANLAGVTWTCVSAGSASCGAASGTGNVATTVDIGAGAGNSVTFLVSGTAPAVTPATISANTATVAVPAGATDPTPRNNSSTVPPIPVSPLAIDAVNDTLGPIVGASGGSTASVIVNDTLNSASAVIGTSVTLTPGTSPNAGLTMNADGTITVAAGTASGSYAYPYTICEVLNPSNCDTATATVEVSAAAIVATDDAGTVSNGAAGGVAVANVLVNDTLNGAAATLTTVTLTQVSTSNPNVTLDPGTGAVSVVAGTASGTYTVVYQICEVLNPSNCDTATVTVSVGAAAIDAVNDTLGPIVGASGGSTASVIVNDTLNSASAVIGTSVTLTPGTSPNAGLTMNADGTITVAAGTASGSYAYPYTICEVLNPSNCDTATATVEVSAAAIVATDDAGTVSNGAAGGVAVANVLVNDTLNGAAATLTTVTLTQVSTSNPNVTLDPGTGAVSVVAGTASGTYTVVYQICEVLNPSNCDTATVTVSVGAAAIDAVNDTLGPIVGASGGSTASVIVNDTLNSASAVIGTSVTLTPGTSPNAGLTMNADGTITVAAGTASGSYAYPYTICEVLNPSNCDTATATVEVSAAAIVATDDAGTVSNGAAGGVAVANVLVNDTLNGAAATLTTVTLTQVSTSNPNVTLDPGTGAVSVVAGTASGTYTVVYQICEVLNPSNCDTATVTVSVGAAAIDAVNDTLGPIVGASGGSTASVIVNDTLNSASAVIGTSVTLTPGTSPNAGLTMNADGTITVAAGTASGSYAYPYTICEVLNPSNCDTATATVEVSAAAIVATDDAGTVSNGAAGGVAVANVLVNDTLNGAAATLTTVTLTQVSTSNPNVTLDPGTGAVSVVAGTASGTYTVVYQICEVLNPSNCDTATVTVSVGAAAIDAVNDTLGPIVGASGGSTASVIVNDTLNSASAVIGTSVTLTPGTSPNAGLTMNADGTITVAAGTASGSYAYPYTICEVLNPSNCDTATATVEVSAAAIVATDDAGTVSNGAAGGVAVANVLVNDTLNGAAATLTTVTLTQVSTSNPNVTLDPGTGAVSVVAGTASGTYTVVYQICEVLNPSNCDTATVTVSVGAAAIDAVNDTLGPIVGASGGSTASVIVNDTLNSASAVIGTSVTLTPGTSPNAGLTMNADGTITVAAGTASGSYAYPYTICEVLNPSNCDTATATVEVSAAAIVATDDAGTVSNGAAGGVAVANVLVNDTLNGAAATLTTVTLTQVSTSNPNVTLDPGTGAVSVVAGTASGTYTVVYQICEVLNPSNCDTATVTVSVGAAAIDAVNDTLGPIVGASGGSTASVIVNDTLNSASAVIGTSVTLTPGTSPNAGLTMNADGTITVAAGTASGSYAYPYTICEVLNPSNCDTATATVEVSAAAIVATDDAGTVSNGAAGGVAVANVLVNDTLNGAAATLTTVTLTQVSTSNPNVTLDPGTGAVSVVAGTASGTYTVVYQICEVLNPSNCDTATVTVSVGAAAIDAVNDTLGPIVGASGGSTASVIVNDTLNSASAVIGTSVTLTPGTSPNAGLTMNADGTITVAAGTASGSYAYPYTICEVLNPSNCDTATATVEVSAAAIVATDDAGTVSNGAAGGVAVANVLVNDTLNGAAATLTTVTLTQVSTSNPNVTLDPGTGAVSVVAGTASGTYTVVYQICEVLNPSNCDTATVTVSVGAAAIDAVNDTLGPIVGASGGSTASVIVNDTLNSASAVIGTSVTLTPGTSPNAGLTMNADGTITVAAGTASGSYAYPYTICEVLNPSNCDTATATVEVSAAAIVATDDAGTVSNGAAGGVAVANVLVNDTLNGAAATLTTVTLTQVSTSNPNVTLDPGTGAVSVVAGTASGTYTVVYQICEVLNPSNCDTATVTVSVGAAAIDAVNDTLGPIVGASGGSTASVIVNDTLNSASAVIGTSVTLTPGTSPNAGLTMNADGTITVAAGTASGSYAYPYTICEVLNPSNCDTATATVEVSAAAIVATDDAGTVSNGAAGGVAVANVLVNDTLNGAAATLTTVTLTQVSTSNPNVTLDPGTGAVSVVAGTASGTYTVVYQICEVLNPSNCDTATVTVSVGAAAIDAVNDTLGPIVGASGGSTASVIVNDTLNSASAVIGTSVTLTPGTSPNAGLTMNADGTITVAAGTASGSYAYPYTICEVLNPSNCDTATATVEVSAAAIVATDDAGTVSNGAAGGVAVANVLVNDTLNGAAATLTTVTLTQVSTSNPNVTLDPGTGAVSVVAGTASGTYTVVYQICEVLNPSNCDTATVTVSVGAAAIDAVNDTLGPIVGASGGSTASVIVNDTLNSASAVIGTSVTLTPGTSPNAGLTMNADGTITVAAGTASGSYAYPYTICEVLNPSNCDTATATVTILPSTEVTYSKSVLLPVGQTEVSVGDTLTYTLQVQVADAATTAPVTLTDTLGTGLTLASVTAGAFSCGNGNPLVCTLPSGTVPGTYVVTYTAIVNDLASGFVRNTVVATGDDAPTCQGTCQTATIVTEPLPAIISYAKTAVLPAGRTQVVAGDVITYTLTTTVAAAPTFGVLTLTDTLGTGLTFGAVTSAGAYTCTGAQPLVCTLPSGTAPGVYEVRYTATVNAQASGVVRNSVVGTSDDNPVCATDCDVETPVASPTILVNKSANPANGTAVQPGQVITYVLSVQVGQAATRAAVTLVDTPGQGLTLGAMPAGCVYNGTTMTCTLPAGTAVGTHTFTYTAIVAASANGRVSNVVVATSDDTTGQPPNCQSCSTEHQVNLPEIRLGKSAGAREVKVGDLVRYTLTVENMGSSDLVDGRITDTPPAGFSYVEGSLVAGDADRMATVSGSQPIRIEGVDVRAGETATLVYVLRVGAGVRPGTHVNQAQARSVTDEPVSNVATAEVTLAADALIDDSLLMGTVFNDRDGDGWQDSAALSGVKVQGGFAPGAYIANSTTVDRGAGPQPEADASSPMLHGIAVGKIAGRQSVAEPVGAHEVVIRQRLSEASFTDDFVLTNDQGVTVRMDAAGNTRIEKSGDAAKGLNAAAPTVERRVSQGEGGYLVDYVIRNAGIDERGIPGVRIASVEGLLIETDQYGRYHLAGMSGGAWERGRNFILKVDPSTLPSGAEFTTDNPLLRRITPGVPVRFDFGVKLPEQVIEGGESQVELELGDVFFAPGSAEVRAQYLPVIDAMAAQVRKYQGGEVVINANGDSEGLAFQRAEAVKDALLAQLDGPAAKALVVSARGSVDDPGSLVVGVDEGGALLGTVLFDTDKAAIRPEFEALLDRIAASLEKRGGGSIAIVGHADLRGSHAYNTALGMRRATAVYEAIAKRLSPEVRAKVRVEASHDPAAPVGVRK